ncbi:hypothetical protein [Flavobacterium sp.]|uniref:hypothetical protein n=1 Tax=Flavobacterium sp. TaxID=239 RepID=UPI00261FFFD5|nr:hypothetical protein [Flavobacterium sp.]
MTKKQQKLEVQVQLQAKLLTAIQTCFDKDSENYIDLDEIVKNGNLNDLFHVSGTRVPQHIFSKITGQNPDPLEFNHICNKLIFQDREDTK